MVVKNDLQERTKTFALKLIDLVERIPKGRSGDSVARQLIRSGTSIGANYREATRAQSKDDFIHKVALSTKEASETTFWLELTNDCTQGIVLLSFENGNSQVMRVQVKVPICSNRSP